MKKIFKILIINVVIFILCIFISDLLIYKNFADNFYKTNLKDYQINKFKYQTEPFFAFDIRTFFDGSDNMYMGRKPDGLEFSDKTPVVIFGCSFAHGQHLEANQTLSYKLSQLLKRPVYNRAISGRGLAQMLFQSESDIFYKDVPPSDTVIYLMIEDHYRRMLVSHINMLDYHFNGNYKLKNNKLIFEDYNNPIKNIIRSSYTIKLLNQKFAKYYIANPDNAQKLTDEVLLYFIQTRGNLERHWKRKVNFIVLFYDDVSYKDILIEKLKENGFCAYSINEDIAPDVPLKNLEYKISKQNGHPNERAWETITPLLVEKLRLN